MVKFRSLHIAFFVCIFSLALSAQSFKTGHQALEDLNAEHIIIKNAFITDMVAAGFDTAEAYIEEEPSAAKGFLFLKSTQLDITASSTPAQVGESLKALIIAKSLDYVPISASQYDARELGSPEIEELYGALLAIVSL